MVNVDVVGGSSLAVRKNESLLNPTIEYTSIDTTMPVLWIVLFTLIPEDKNDTTKYFVIFFTYH